MRSTLARRVSSRVVHEMRFISCCLVVLCPITIERTFFTLRKEELSISFVMDIYSTTDVDRHALVVDKYSAAVDLYLDTSGGFRVKSLEYEGIMAISRIHEGAQAHEQTRRLLRVHLR